MLEAVADGDPNKQFEQVRTFVNRRVDGIIIVPKDGKTVIPMIRAANVAGIPIVLFNRPADRTDASHTVIAPDNVSASPGRQSPISSSRRAQVRPESESGDSDR